MKKYLLIILSLVAVGCAAITPVTQNFPNWTQTQNQRNAHSQRENIKGLTQDEILTKFGAPDQKITTQDILEGEREGWIYGSAIGHNRQIRVTFVDGVVKSISYN